MDLSNRSADQCALLWCQSVVKFLLNVGAEKAGTTWLYKYFQSHPDFHDMGKELNIIQRDDVVPTFPKSTEYKLDLDTYFKAVAETNKVTGDFTHYEGSTTNIFRLIRDGLLKHDIEVVPVYIMRDPIRRAWSAWHMLGGGDLEMPTPAYFLVQKYLQCKYKETIESLNDVFEDPLYFFYEDFFQQEHVDLICDRLCISKHLTLTNVINKGVYNQEVTEDFIQKFCLTQKNIEAVQYIRESFKNVPWNIEDYKKVAAG